MRYYIYYSIILQYNIIHTCLVELTVHRAPCTTFSMIVRMCIYGQVDLQIGYSLIYSIPQDSSVKICCNTTYKYENNDNSKDNLKTSI